VTRLIIFDCDGVLVDSERLSIKIDVAVLAELGWVLTEAEAVERFVGLSMKQMRDRVESHLGRTLPEDWEEEFQHRLRETLASELRPVEGIVEALNAIHDTTCVASSGTQEKIRFSLGLTGLYERFAGRIFSATEISRGKPAPDLFLHAAEQMGVEPSSCVVVEDSAPGVTAALAAGMRVLAYAGGVTPAARLSLPGAVVFDDMRDLAPLLKHRTGRIA
jgi:HAD superfamily hydrolase (TIGR01509 family)